MITFHWQSTLIISIEALLIFVIAFKAFLNDHIYQEKMYEAGSRSAELLFATFVEFCFGFMHVNGIQHVDFYDIPAYRTWLSLFHWITRYLNSYINAAEAAVCNSCKT